jgi:hypothetical protein
MGKPVSLPARAAADPPTSANALRREKDFYAAVLLVAKDLIGIRRSIELEPVRDHERRIDLALLDTCPPVQHRIHFPPPVRFEPDRINAAVRAAAIRHLLQAVVNVRAGEVDRFRRYG